MKLWLKLLFGGGLGLLLNVLFKRSFGKEADLEKARDTARKEADDAQGRRRVQAAAEQRRLEVELHKERQRPLADRVADAYAESKRRQAARGAGSGTG